jgi:hypothetical protein
MTEASSPLALNIRWIARRQAIPLTHIPPLAGVAQGFFFSVLAGQASPTVRWCWKVAKALGVDVHELFKP